MPGGQGGGAGGLAGILMRGVAGGRGPGGGMGMNDPGRGGQNTETISDLYDVDRWKRADDLDSGFEPTMVQTVRDAWERNTEEKRKNSPVSRIRAVFQRKNRKNTLKRERKMERRALGSRSRRDDYERERDFEDAGIKHEHTLEKERSEERPNRAYASVSPERPRGTLEGNTIITPGMRKAAHHVPESFQDDKRWSSAYADRHFNGSSRNPIKRNPIGLTTHAGIDSFFQASPLNSTLLAVDVLSSGPLTLNQVRQEEVPVTTASGFFPVEQAVPESGFPEKNPLSVEEMSSNHAVPANLAAREAIPAGSDHSERSAFSSASSGGSNVTGNLITNHTGTHYMDAFRESREQRKYEVHVRNH